MASGLARLGPPLGLVISILVAFLQSAIVRAELSPECQNIDQDYAYDSVRSFVRLGPDGVVLLRAHKSICLHGIDIHEMRPEMQDTSRGAQSAVCEEVRSQIDAKGILTSTSEIRWTLGLGHTIYYGVKGQGGIQKFDIDPNIVLDKLYASSKLGPAIEAALDSYQIEAAILIGTKKRPGLLVVQEDVQWTRTFKYYQTKADKTLDVKGEVVGTVPRPVSAIYVPNEHKLPKIEAVIFFGKHYGRIKLDLSESVESNKLEVSPILPVQSMFGCPINLCWWPLVDDVFYYNEAYYFFQGLWMFRLEEGIKGDIPLGILSVSEAYELKKYGIDFTVFAVYIDFIFGNHPMIIRKKPTGPGFVLAKLVITGSSSNKVDIKVEQTQYGIVVNGSAEVCSAVMLPHEKVLWVLLREDNQFFLRGFNYSEAQKDYIPTAHGNMPLADVYGIFFNYRTNHLFMLSNFYLFAFKEPKLPELNSHCSVTYAAVFFNCPTSYYSARMGLPNINNQGEYFSMIKSQTTDQQLLSGKCNFEPNMSRHNLKFAPWRPPKVPSSTKSPFLIYLCVTGAIVAGTLLAICIFYFVASRRINKRDPFEDAEQAKRREGEQKLKNYMKDRYKKSPKPNKKDNKKSPKSPKGGDKKQRKTRTPATRTPTTTSKSDSQSNQSTSRGDKSKHKKTPRR